MKRQRPRVPDHKQRPLPSHPFDHPTTPEILWKLFVYFLYKYFSFGKQLYFCFIFLLLVTKGFMFRNITVSSRNRKPET